MKVVGWITYEVEIPYLAGYKRTFQMMDRTTYGVIHFLMVELSIPEVGPEMTVMQNLKGVSL